MAKSLLFYVTLGIIALHNSIMAAEQWTTSEKHEANTAVSSNYLDEEEKSGVMYLNLARLYPKKFARLEVADFPIKGGYKYSLISYLEDFKPTTALKPRLDMSENAACFAKELGESGRASHDRVVCETKNYSESCAFSWHTGRTAIIALLIDNNVPSLGHRLFCMSYGHTQIGIATYSHTVYGTCFVLELK